MYWTCFCLTHIIIAIGILLKNMNTWFGINIINVLPEQYCIVLVEQNVIGCYTHGYNNIYENKQLIEPMK